MSGTRDPFDDAAPQSTTTRPRNGAYRVSTRPQSATAAALAQTGAPPDLFVERLLVGDARTPTEK